MLNKIKGAVFDMDGTLVDSLFLWDKTWSLFGEKYRNDPTFRPTPEDDKAMRTMTLKDAMNYVHTRYGMGESGRALLDVVNRLIADFYRNEVRTKEGVDEFLKECKKRGITMCIASATAREFIEAGMKHCGIESYFSRIFSCAELGKGKDEPDIFLAAAEFLGTDPAETCVFEDSLTAVQTARGIGMKTVGIYDRYNYGQKELAELSDVYVAEGETLNKLLR